MNSDTDQPIQDKALDHLRELLSTHWREAKDSADDEGKFAIGFRVSVQDGAPAKLKVKCSISKTITDEIESQVDDPTRLQYSGFINSEAVPRPGAADGTSV